MKTLLAIVPALTVFFIIAFGVGILKFVELRLFNKGPAGNPYRRYCKKCGQCQVQMQLYADTPRATFWADQGAIKDESCRCHKYSEYYG